MAIAGRHVRLRAPEASDITPLHAWANDEELWRCLGGWRFPSSLVSAETWVRELGGDPLNQRFVIEEASTPGRAVGTANLVEIDWRNRHATHGMLLGSTADRGRGLGRDTVMAVMRHAFDELGLERLNSDIIEYNEASHRLYVGRCGWLEEGRQRRWHHRGGRFWDRIIVGVTREDYRALVAEIGYWD